MKKTMQDGLFAAFDLGSHSLKAAVIEVIDSRPRLASIEEENLKPMADYPSEEDYRVYLVETLQSLAGRIPLKDCRKISVLFSNREMQVKIIELPSQVQAEQIERSSTGKQKSFSHRPFVMSPTLILTASSRKTPIRLRWQ